MNLIRIAAFSALIACASATCAAAPEVLEPAVEQVRTLLRNKQVDAAVERGEAAIAAQPGSGKAWLWLGNAYGQKALAAGLLSKASWAGKCRDAYVKAVELAPDDPDARFSLLQYYLQAPGFMGGGSDKAQTQVDGLEAIGPAWGHMGKAAVLIADDKPDEAVAEYQSAVAAAPDNARALLGLISIHVGRKDFVAARAATDAALARNPGDPVALYMLGRIAIDDGQRIEEGLKGLETFIGLASHPEQLPLAAAWWRKALLLEKLGQAEAAIAALSQAVQLDATLEGARKDLARLRP
jgi:tetratricopeptide (TPR) repeat protein